MNKNIFVSVPPQNPWKKNDWKMRDSIFFQQNINLHPLKESWARLQFYCSSTWSHLFSWWMVGSIPERTLPSLYLLFSSLQMRWPTPCQNSAKPLSACFSGRGGTTDRSPRFPRRRKPSARSWSALNNELILYVAGFNPGSRWWRLWWCCCCCCKARLLTLH